MEALLTSETWSATSFENFLFLTDCLIIPMHEVIEVGDFDAKNFLVIVQEGLELELHITVHDDDELVLQISFNMI